MATDVILRDLATVMRRTFGTPANVPIGPDTTSNDIDGWDSLSHAMLIMNVEHDFGIELPLDGVSELENVGALVNLIASVNPDATLVKGP